MKEVKGSGGEVELQTPEYAGVGPVRDDRDLRKRVETLEAQVRSLQLAMPKGIPT